MPKEPLTPDRLRSILAEEVSEYLREGWVIQTQTDTRAQLTGARKPGPFAKLFSGNAESAPRKKVPILVIEVNERGQVSTKKRNESV